MTIKAYYVARKSGGELSFKIARGWKKRISRFAHFRQKSQKLLLLWLQLITQLANPGSLFYSTCKLPSLLLNITVLFSEMNHIRILHNTLLSAKVLYITCQR